jgi:hypothetical protein
MSSWNVARIRAQLSLPRNVLTYFWKKIANCILSLPVSLNCPDSTIRAWERRKSSKSSTCSKEGSIVSSSKTRIRFGFLSNVTTITFSWRCFQFQPFLIPFNFSNFCTCRSLHRNADVLTKKSSSEPWNPSVFLGRSTISLVSASQRLEDQLSCFYKTFEKKIREIKTCAIGGAFR